jgi:protein-S-isoprenylcysteine O-methyltransferase Ste14
MPTTRGTALVAAWIGAGLFAWSLAWFVYCYLVRYGQPASSDAILPPLLVNVFLFSAFALHHSVLARSGIKRTISRVVPCGLERSLYTWTASLLFLGVCTWWRPVPGVLYQLDGGWRAGAWAIQVLGVLITLRASSVLDILDLAGVRDVQRSDGDPPVDRATPHLTTRGLYGIVRHPLYFAWALFVFASPTMTGTRAAFAVISTAYLLVAIPWEERGLIDTFGPEYELYRRQVPSRMIPFLY